MQKKIRISFAKKKKNVSYFAQDLSLKVEQLKRSFEEKFFHKFVNLFRPYFCA
jgi:hypothetical protein